MKASDGRQMGSLVSLLLKLISGVLILSFFIDVAILLYSLTFSYPPDVQPLQRQLAIANQIVGFGTNVVDRGVVPLVAVAFFLASLWMDGTAGNYPPRRKLIGAFNVGIFLFSTLMSLFFLLIIPLHINNVSFVKDEAIKRIGQDATTAESQLNTQIQQQQTQISNLLNDAERLQQLDTAIKSGQVQGQQLTQLQNLQKELEQFKQDPQALTKQADTSRKQNLTRIRERKIQLEKQASEDAFKSTVRIGSSSLLLAIAYAAIGWTGIRGLGMGGRKA